MNKSKVENGKVIEELSVILMTLDIGGINRYEAQKDIVSLISNALNQQRSQIVGEIREWAENNEAKNGLFDKENNTSFIPEWPVVFKNDLLRLLTKLEK